MRAVALLLLLILGGHVAFMVSPLHGHRGPGTAAFAETGHQEAAAHRLSESHATPADATLRETGLAVATKSPAPAATPNGLDGLEAGSEHCPIAPAPAPRWEAGVLTTSAAALLWAPPGDAWAPALAAVVPHPPDSPRLHARLGVFLN